jgi:hypothetical protein
MASCGRTSNDIAIRALISEEKGSVTTLRMGANNTKERKKVANSQVERTPQPSVHKKKVQPVPKKGLDYETIKWYSHHYDPLCLSVSFPRTTASEKFEINYWNDDNKTEDLPPELTSFMRSDPPCKSLKVRCMPDMYRKQWTVIFGEFLKTNSSLVEIILEDICENYATELFDALSNTSSLVSLRIHNAKAFSKNLPSTNDAFIKMIKKNKNMKSLVIYGSSDSCTRFYDYGIDKDAFIKLAEIFSQTEIEYFDFTGYFFDLELDKIIVEKFLPKLKVLGVYSSGSIPKIVESIQLFTKLEVLNISCFALDTQDYKSLCEGASYHPSLKKLIVKGPKNSVEWQYVNSMISKNKTMKWLNLVADKLHYMIYEVTVYPSITQLNSLQNQTPQKVFTTDLLAETLEKYNTTLVRVPLCESYMASYYNHNYSKCVERANKVIFEIFFLFFPDEDFRLYLEILFSRNGQILLQFLPFSIHYQNLSL